MRKIFKSGASFWKIGNRMLPLSKVVVVLGSDLWTKESNNNNEGWDVEKEQDLDAKEEQGHGE